MDAMAPIFSFCEMARHQIWISSPACGPTMEAPRMRPLGSQHLDLAFGLPLRLGAVVFLEAPGEDIHVLVGFAGLDFGQADMGEFRIGVGDPGHAE